MLNLLHYDRSSLFAGKVHALLTRPYVKGRDLYDLLWYLADRAWPPPNLVFLNAALSQTGWQGPALTEKNWRRVLSDRLKGIAWERAREDVLPFLEKEKEVDLITRENALRLLKAGRVQRSRSGLSASRALPKGRSRPRKRRK
jgi:hypothetical protein